ncbi:hypothetical protein ACTQ49_10305 [Luteococcus sp. Sow4_B9]|uniref:hypothetical protein n=1 Tax=Luteococcus sp. Sow4_B9 TaxID=3438792 RepID=UPI003F9AE3DD
MWRKIVVILLGVALAAGFGVSALAPQQSTVERDVEPFLANYDGQAAAYWRTGRTEWPALEKSLGPIRSAVQAEGFQITEAASQSVVEEAKREGNRWVVKASTTTSWTLVGIPSAATGSTPSPSAAPTQTSSSSTDAHRFTFDAQSGELVSDEFLPDS